ncbi:DNA topoisomerase 2 [Tyrophagus putrescentiae]|nr:DNA topoisomerase 2 [Tyrophagus putrescentiae]
MYWPLLELSHIFTNLSSIHYFYLAFGTECLTVAIRWMHFVTVQEGPNAAEALGKAFGSKEKEVEKRKQWISSALQVSHRSTAHAALSSKTTITIECLINELLILALTAQVRQRVPRFCDTLRTGERMIVSTMLNCSKNVYLRGDELCGKVSSKNNYRHSHLSLYETVARMAKTAAGCGHCPLLKSRGELGGKSAPPPQSHYTHFKRSPVANLLVTITSEDLLLPILPPALLNGSDGMTHGVKFSFPMFSPEDVAGAVMQSLRGEPVEQLLPKWNGITSHVTRRSPLEYQLHDDTGEKLLSGCQQNKKAFVANLKVISQNGSLLTFTSVEEFVVKWTDERLQLAVEATGKEEVAVKEQWTAELMDFLHWFQAQSTSVEKRHNKRQCTADLRQVLSSSPEANVESPATAATAAAAPMEVADVEGGDESEAPQELIDQGSSMFSPSVASQYTSPPEEGEAHQFEQDDGDWGEDDGEIADMNFFDDDSPASPSPPTLPEQQHQQPANPFISASSVFASSSVPITTDCPGARCHFREHPLPQDEHIFRFHTMLRTYACSKCSYKGKKWSTVKEHLKGKKTHNIKFKHHLYIIDLMTTPDWEQEKERQLAEDTAV